MIENESNDSGRNTFWQHSEHGADKVQRKHSQKESIAAIKQLEVKTKWIFILMTASPFHSSFFFQTLKILQLIFCFPEISLESPGNYISILPRQRLCELTDQWVLGFSQPTGGPETGETPCQTPFLVIATIPHHRTGDNPGCLVNHSYSLLHFKNPKEFFSKKRSFPV